MNEIDNKIFFLLSFCEIIERKKRRERATTTTKNKIDKNNKEIKFSNVYIHFLFLFQATHIYKEIEETKER